MKTTEDLVKECFSEFYPEATYVSFMSNKDYGSHFKVTYVEREGSTTESVDISYLDYITWAYNRFIAPEKIYINLN